MSIHYEAIRPDGASFYDTLTRPWRTVVGPIHPDDKELS